MRHAFIALAALAGSALSTSAFALNPQPLPPGAHAPSHGSPSISEPPDPCLGVRGVAHARCLQRHQRLHPQTRHTVPPGQY